MTSLENQTYLHVYPSRIGVYDDATIIISQNVKWRVGPWDGNAPQLMATCYLIRLGHPLQALWEVQLEADEGRLSEPFYHAVAYGCCGGKTNNALFNLRTGVEVMEYTEPLMVAELPYTFGLTRYIGYRSGNAWPIRSGDKSDPDTLYIGTLSYASADSLISQVVFSGKPGYCANYCDIVRPYSIWPITRNPVDIVQYGTDVVLHSAKNGANPMAFDNFGVELVFEPGDDSGLRPNWDTVLVQIAHDRIVLQPREYEHVTVQVLP